MTKQLDIPHELTIDLSKDSRETFIPLRHQELIERLEAEFQLSVQDKNRFRNLCARLQSIFHVEHLTALISIEELYCPLDPDSEFVQPDTLEESELKMRTDRFFDRVADLAYAAHYQRLTREELKRMIRLSSQGGMKLEVDFEVFERLEIFARGYRMVDAKRRRWQNWFREETIKLPEFHRLILLFRIKKDQSESAIADDVDATDSRKRKKKKKQRNVDKSIRSDTVYIKNFKNIPETDLEVLLPGTKVKLTALDRGKILLPTLTGAAFKAAMPIYKIIRGLLLVGITATIVSTWETMFLVAAAMIGYIARSVFTYFRTKDKYEFNLTKNLYLKNLDNNAGVLYRVLNEAQEQELCETILGYTMLWQRGIDNGLDEETLDDLAEEFLIAETELDVDFDLHDALGKMARLGLADVDSQGNWKAVPLESIELRLTKNWESLFRGHGDTLDDQDGLSDNLLTS